MTPVVLQAAASAPRAIGITTGYTARWPSNPRNSEGRGDKECEYGDAGEDVVGSDRQELAGAPQAGGRAAAERNDSVDGGRQAEDGVAEQGRDQRPVTGHPRKSAALPRRNRHRAQTHDAVEQDEEPAERLASCLKGPSKAEPGHGPIEHESERP